MVRFGAVEVDEELEEVRVDGATRRVEPQVFAVLTHLISNRHRVVTKDELLDEVWGTRHVSDGAITSRIKSARRSIGDTGRDQALIRTIHGRGYRFVAELDDGPPTAGDREPTSAPRPPLDPPAGRSTDERWPLAGRDAELAQAVALSTREGDGGLLLTGPAGLGKTRLASAVLDALADRSVAVARVSGHASATSVPLATLAHLLPNDIADLSGVQGELARAVLLQRARAALAVLAGGRRLVLMVDDADRVDGLSLALIASMMSSGSLFAVMTQRVEADEPLALEHLVRSGELRHLRLGPVPADQLTALLTRVLEGPVQPRSARSLVDAAAGNPGVLRQLVEASTSSGSLVLRSGVWRLVGPLAVPSDLGAAIRTRLDALDPEPRGALELLAMAGDLDLDLAFDLVDEEVLDQLEFDGLIVVRELGSDSRVELAHPLYGEIVLATLPALRARRHRSRLEQALAGRATAGAADRLLLVQLQLETGSEVDDEMLLESAGLAFAEDRTGLTLRLLDKVPEDRRTDRHELLRGEALYMRGRFDEAGAAWQGIDLDALDDASAAVVARRLATWLFHAKWRHTEALETLRDRLDRFEGDTFQELESYWVELASLDGRWADEAIERAERSLDAASPHARSTYLSGAAMGRFLHGEHRVALERIEARRRLDRTLDDLVLWQGPGYSNFVAASIFTEVGDVAEAWRVLEHLDGTGAVPSFGYEGLTAGRLALRSGRYEQVLDWLDPHIQLADALGIMTNGRALQATTALAALELGDLDRARADVEALRSDLPEAPGVARLDILWAVHVVEAATGDAEAAGRALLEEARVARSADLAVIEAMLVSAAVAAVPTEEGVDHLERLAGRIDGELIGLRHRAARARLGLEDPQAVVEALEACGLRWDAAQIRRWAR